MLNVPTPADRAESMKVLAAARERLRAPFAPDEVELLPKEFKDSSGGRPVRMRCTERNGDRVSVDGLYCGGWHGKAAHIHYIGHASITMRLNEVDPDWQWEPAAVDDRGAPVRADGGMWGTLTVLGKPMRCFGDAGGKNGPDATKEMIGDLIRNGAMRHGVGTYLWSRSERSQAIRDRGAEVDAADEGPQVDPADDEAAPVVERRTAADEAADILAKARATTYSGELRTLWENAGERGLLDVEVEGWRLRVLLEARGEELKAAKVDGGAR